MGTLETGSALNKALPGARAAVQALRASPIREVANAGMGDPEVLAFWFGEPDEVTPAFIRDAGIASLNAGETFYTQNLGIPELREAIAAYQSRLHGQSPLDPSRIAVTNSGMSALMVAVQTLLDPGDRAVVVTPLWPNLVEIPKILSARVHTHALRFTESGWRLDLDALIADLTPDTRVLLVNSPNNPTGWAMSAQERDAILAHCRKHGIWIVSDDAYERLYYVDGHQASPGFLDVADDHDRLLAVNTFSKSWLMTGWRLGWISAPPGMEADFGKLLEYNTSCAPKFVQRAGVAAVTQGEAVVAATRSRFRAARDFLAGELNALPGVTAIPAPGAMYLFFRVEGMKDSLAFCKQLVADHKLGLAPGIAFGPEGEGFIRWCYAGSTERLAEGVKRLRAAL